LGDRKNSNLSDKKCKEAGVPALCCTKKLSWILQNREDGKKEGEIQNQCNRKNPKRQPKAGSFAEFTVLGWERGCYLHRKNDNMFGRKHPEGEFVDNIHTHAPITFQNYREDGFLRDIFSVCP
jgi:hypothetical protein